MWWQLTSSFLVSHRSSYAFLQTILHMLGEGDMFSLVEFSNSARVLLQYSDVGGPGARREAIKLVEGMSARGGTNLYDGLMRGIKLADNVIDTSGDAGIPGWEEALPAAVGMSSAVFLLTDGVPNISPPRGIVQMLDRYVKRRGLDCSVVTFGFGYNLDSHLLHEIAVRGGGQFNFIPDSQLLGTVFVHAISNLLSTGCKKVSLRLELGEEAARRGVVLDNDSVSQAYKGITSGGSEVRVELGTVQLGQSRDIPVSVSMGGSEGVTGPDREPLVRAVVEYTTLGGSRGAAECSGLLWESEGEEEAGVNNSSERLKEFRCRHRSRLLVVDCLSEVVRRRPEMFDHAGSAVSELVASLSELASNHGCDNALSSSCLGLKEDVEGEVWTAVSRKDWFTRWGVHYLTSLSRAHLLQLCCNFKDPGLQSYGGRLFDKLRDEADEVFLGLPLLSVAETNGGGGQMPYPTGFGTGMSWSMSYHNSADPCVSADARIRMADGSLKKAGEIVKGDVVETRVAGGAVRASAAVACVLETVPGKSGVLTPPMVEVGGGVDGARAARVTAWHPVRAGDGAAWQFPAAVGRVLRRAERGLFSFVLEEGVCVVMEGGVQAVTLGHGMEGPVVGHRYLGTCRVVRDLMGFGGWETGRVVVESGGMRREGQRICGFGEEVEVVVAARVGQCHRAILAECRN